MASRDWPDHHGWVTLCHVANAAPDGQIVMGISATDRDVPTGELAGSAHDARVAKRVMIAGILVVAAIIVNGVTHLFPEIKPYTGFLTRPNERSLIEFSEAFLWLFAAITFFIAAYRSRRHGTTPVLYSFCLFMFGALGVVVFGEETSWGQHFGLFEPPASVVAVNAQQEFNFHNLNLTEILGLSPDNPLHEPLKSAGNIISPLFQLCCVLMWAIVPMLLRLFPEDAFLRRNYPLPLKRISVFLLSCYIAYFVIDKLLFDIAEIIEFAISLTAALVASDVYARTRPGGVR